MSCRSSVLVGAKRRSPSPLCSRLLCCFPESVLTSRAAGCRDETRADGEDGEEDGKSFRMGDVSTSHRHGADPEYCLNLAELREKVPLLRQTSCRDTSGLRRPTSGFTEDGTILEHMETLGDGWDASRWDFLKEVLRLNRRHSSRNKRRPLLFFYTSQ